jgi:hypothetical protein
LRVAEYTIAKPSAAMSAAAPSIIQSRSRKVTPPHGRVDDGRDRVSERGGAASAIS